MIFSPFSGPRLSLLTIGLLLALPASPTPAATLVWNNLTGNWSAAGNWTPTGPPTGDPTDILTFGGDVGTIYTATNDIAGTLPINAFNFTASGGTGSSPAHVLNGNGVRLTGTNPQVTATGAGAISVNLPVHLGSTGSTIAWNGAGVGVITFNGPLSGTANIVKSDTSTFRFGTLIDGTPSGNTWMGSLAINAGVVRFNNNAFSGPSALRANPVSINAATPTGAMLIVQPNAADDFDAGMRLGTISGTGGTVQARKELTGSDQINFNSGSLLITAMTDGTFAGTIKNSRVGIGSLNDARFTVRGEGTQTFTGTTDIAKDVFVGGRATLVLAGTASLASQTTGAIILTGGNFRLDNSGGNLNRLRDNSGTVLDSNGGGTFTLVGNSAGTTENVAQLQLGATQARSGSLSVQVQHTAAGAPTVLQFSNLNRNNGEFTAAVTKTWLNEFATIDFSATGGTLGTAGNQPQIKFTTTPALQATGGLLRNSEGTALDNSVGWATANGDSFATYDTTTGIKPVTTAAFPATSSPGLNALLDADGTISSPGTFSLNSLKIQPGAAGQSLSITSTGSLDTTAILLAGPNSYTIANNGGTGGLSGNDTRYIHVQNPGTTLTINTRVNGSLRPVVKAGAGTLALGSSVNGTSAVATIINSGTLRAESGVSLPGGELRLRGGVYEITGGTFSRPLGNTGGTVSWSGFDPEDNGGAGAGIDEDRGSGGFAAFGADPSLDAIVDLNTAGPTTFTWEDRFFVNSGYALMFGSPLANRRVVWVDNIGLAEAGVGATQNYNAREFRVIDNPSVTTDSARLTGVISGTVQNDLLKTGDGLLELTGTNTYAGATLIHQGQMVINGSIIQSFLTDVRMNAILSGGQTTAGTGSVGAVRVQNGGTISPGTAAGRTSILNARDTEFVGPTAKLAIEIGGVTAGGNLVDGYDQLNITGTVQLNGATLELAQLGGFSFVDGQIVFIVKNDGTDPINGVFAQGSFVNFGSQILEIGYGANAEGVPSFTGGNDIALRIIPEPSSVLVLAAGACALAGVRRRRTA